MKPIILSLLLVLSGSLSAADSDSDIWDRMIQESVASYSGSCACPWNRASNGSRCGKRSAYSRPGGASPLCYASDISDAEVNRYRD